MVKLDGMTKKILAMLEKEGIGIAELRQMSAEELAMLPGITLDRAHKIVTAARAVPPVVEFMSDDGVAQQLESKPRSVRIQRIYEANK